MTANGAVVGQGAGGFGILQVEDTGSLALTNPLTVGSSGGPARQRVQRWRWRVFREPYRSWYRAC